MTRARYNSLVEYGRRRDFNRTITTITRAKIAMDTFRIVLQQRDGERFYHF